MGENLFEEEFTIEALSQMGNPLERLSSLVDFEMFRPVLEDVLLTKECKTPAGRKPIDVVLMFKVIFLQRYYGLGDHQIQYQIIDRTSFRQFLGIHTVAEIPDEKTVWACRDKLSKAGTFDLLFDQFRAYLDSLGLSFNEGKIIDATFVEAPVSATPVKRTSKSKRATAAVFGSQRIATPRRRRSASLTSAATRTAMLAGRRNAVNHYGYKDHVKADKKTKLIEKYHTTDASVHDSNVIEPLTDEKDKGQDLWLDAGYEGKEDVVIKCGMNPIICEKGHKNHPLTDEQKSRNRERSHSRCLVEHIFGFVEGAMNGSLVRSIGMIRAKASTALTCLVYNIFRYERLC